jgi:hypothetical protein
LFLFLSINKLAIFAVDGFAANAAVTDGRLLHLQQRGGSASRLVWPLSVLFLYCSLKGIDDAKLRSAVN